MAHACAAVSGIETLDKLAFLLLAVDHIFLTKDGE